MDRVLLMSVTGVLIVFAALTWLPAYQRHLVSSFYRRTPIEIPDQVRPRLVRRLTNGTRWATIPAAAVLATGLAVQGDGGTLNLRLWTAAAGAAALLGLVIVSLVPEGRGPDTSRIARVRLPTVGDYVPRSSRVIGWIMIALLGTVLLITDAATGRLPPGSLGLALIVLLFIAGQVASALIVRRPQPAESPLELVWSDALRAQSLVELLYLPLLLVYLAFTSLFFEGLSSAPGALGALGGFGEAIAFFGFFATVIVTRSTRYRFLERLWPRGVSWEEEDRIWAEKTGAEKGGAR